MPLRPTIGHSARPLLNPIPATCSFFLRRAIPARQDRFITSVWLRLKRRGANTARGSGSTFHRLRYLRRARDLDSAGGEAWQFNCDIRQQGLPGLRRLGVEPLQPRVANSGSHPSPAFEGAALKGVRSSKAVPKLSALFVSYSHKDDEARQTLDTHMAHLKREAARSSWMVTFCPATNLLQTFSECSSAPTFSLRSRAHIICTRRNAATRSMAAR